MENRFNLIDEPWIPVAGIGRVSLRQIFRHSEYRKLGGNPVQKIALMKLLLAIAQAAATPNDENDWLILGASGLAEKCLFYLDKWHDRFYLYGEKPFLQMPEIARAKKNNYGAFLPDISTGNTTIHMQSQIEKELDDANKTLLIISLMGFAFAGKQVDNSISLTKDYKGKSKAGKPGPGISHRGLLHTFIYGNSLQDTIWLNLFSHEKISSCNLFSQGTGTAPWEMMPEGEDCPKAINLKNSLMGRLIPICRFCFLEQEGIHCSEGITHLNYLDGFFDPTIAVDTTGKKNKVLWVNPEKKPWRQLPALLSVTQQAKKRYECLQLSSFLSRVHNLKNPFAIWSGGVSVTIYPGEQKVAGKDDFVESEIQLKPEFFLGEPWFNQLILEMEHLEGIGKKLYGGILNFYKTQLTDGSAFAAQGANIFWQLCEQDFQNLIDACGEFEEASQERAALRHRFAGYVHRVYDQCCPNDTARQMEAWAKSRPNLSYYLKKEEA